MADLTPSGQQVKQPDQMSAHILSIGNELLIGDTLNTNASWIGRFLTEQGFRVSEVRTIPDDYRVIRLAVSEAMNRAGLVIATGGLGPTHDDVTKKVVADLFDSELVEDANVLAFLEKMFRSRGYAFTPSNREQAMVPAACEVLFNEQGTAPGMWFEGGGSGLAVLPGVPYEMRHLMETGVRRKIREHFEGRLFRSTIYLKTAGVPESVLSDKVIGDLSGYLEEGNGVAFLPGTSGVTIRVSREGATREEAEQSLAPLARFIRKQADGLIYGEGRDVKLSEVVGTLLSQKGLTLAAAESCTGGMLSDEITDVPGSSSYFKGGVIAYADEVKIEHLGVSREMLQAHGAVSREVALQMARGVAGRFGSDISVSATGIAGPGGGTDEKPVGLVWMGFWLQGEHFALRARFTNDRLINKERTVTVILETLRRHLLDLGTLPYDLKPERI